jgi:DNA-binding helix-hairpin-helix protein with protein kinase domain
MRQAPDPGETLWMLNAKSPVTVGRKLNQGAQGTVFEAKVDNALFAVKWLRPKGNLIAMERSIGALAQRPRPHKAFVWPMDLVKSSEIVGFGYVMPYMSPRFVSFSRMVDSRPNFRDLIRVARNLVDAFASLHASGQCYRDISFRNLFVDPSNAEVAICDNDNVGLDDDEVFVKGSNEFMAPEILRDEKLPCTATDLYSLAVFLFMIFVRGHPLEGIATDPHRTAVEGQQVDANLAVRRNFGFNPRFVFDPEDESNRPPPGDTRFVYWSIYPRFFKSLFVKSFTTGISDASVSARVTATSWRRGLTRLMDCWCVHSCRAELFWDPEDPSHRCWNCSEMIGRPHLLEVGGRTVVLCDGTVVDSDRIAGLKSGALGRVERHPEEPGSIVLRNLTETTWTVLPEDEPRRRVVPGQRLRIRPMTVDFGVTTGRIT